MSLFAPLYDRVMRWSRHRYAIYYLGVLSFLESSVFPIPTVFMLAPMAAAEPKRSFFLATIATVTSVAGGLVGYLLGYFAFELVEPWVIRFGYYEAFQTAQQWFDQWGFWAVLLAGISPIPYKVFTIAAGSFLLGIVPFVLGSLIGRASQFFIAAGLIYFIGPRIEPMIKRYIEWIGWSILVLAVVAYSAYQLIN